MKLRKIIPAVVCIACQILNSAAATESSESERDRPNIIFILADDLGWTDIQVGDVGPNVEKGINYGSRFYQTPNIKRIANEGLSFTHCFAHPNCAPTRAAILSGQYAPRQGNGVYHVMHLARESRKEKPTRFVPPEQRADIPPEHTLYSELLQASGYVTCHIGKYHVANHEGGQKTMPEEQGFDFNYGGNQHGGPRSYFAAGQRFSPAIGSGLDPFARTYTEQYILQNLFPAADGNQPLSLSGSEKHVEDALGDAAIEFLRQHRKGDRADQPFYLQLHHYGVHSPIGKKQARKDLLEKYRSVDGNNYHSSNAYAAILENLDQTIGRVLKFLDDPDGDMDTSDSISNDTLIIFTSDNGGIRPTDNFPLRHVKGSFYNGGLRVPLIVRLPGRVPASMQTDTLVHSVDFYPTLLEAAELKKPAELKLDGQSFWPHASDPINVKRNRKPIFYHFPGYLDQRARPCNVVIKRIKGADYKLIYNYDPGYTGGPSNPDYQKEGLKVLDDAWELYCFSDDLSETRDLIGKTAEKQHAEIAIELVRDLVDWLDQPTNDWQPDKLVNRSSGKEVPFPDESMLREILDMQKIP